LLASRANQVDQIGCDNALICAKNRSEGVREKSKFASDFNATRVVQIDNQK